MPQSLASIHIHLVFSTKNRVRYLDPDLRPELHAYMATILKKLKCVPVLINSTEDHVHVLFDIARTISVSQVVEEIKTSTSKWLKTKKPDLANFAWQTGYGAFAVSLSKVGAVCEYISRQEEHHRVKSFKEEYLEFLQRHNIKYDERYVWD